jgi:hypothetical protein
MEIKVGEIRQNKAGTGRLIYLGDGNADVAQLMRAWPAVMGRPNPKGPMVELQPAKPAAWKIVKQITLTAEQIAHWHELEQVTL